jgi:hypothetical protein
MNSELKPPLQSILKWWTYLAPSGFAVYFMVRVIEASKVAPFSPLTLLQYLGLLLIWTYVFWFAFPMETQTSQVFKRIAIIAAVSFSLIAGFMWLLGPSMGGISVSGQDKAMMAVCSIAFAPSIDYGFKLIKPSKMRHPPKQ